MNTHTDLIVATEQARAWSQPAGEAFTADQFPDDVIYPSELTNFSDFEVLIVGVMLDEKGAIHCEEGGYLSEQEALSADNDYVYWSVRGRSKLATDANSPWYPIHDAETEDEANALIERFEAEIKLSDAA